MTDKPTTDLAPRPPGGPAASIAESDTRKAAEHLGGGVTLESAPGKGSVFQVELPERTE